MDNKEIFKVYETHKVIKENHKNYESLNKKILKVNAHKKLMEEAQEELDKEAREIIESTDHPYTYSMIEKEGRHLLIRLKAYLYCDDISHLENDIKNKMRKEKREISFTNLNDLNAAKFLTDDEKREILGYGKKSLTTNK